MTKRTTESNGDVHVTRQDLIALLNEDLAREYQAVISYVNRFFGDMSPLQLNAKSSADCIHIGIGPEGEKYTTMTTLPPTREKSAPIEIWVHSSILSEPVSALIKLTTPKTMVPISIKTQILSALSILPSSADSAVDIAIEDGWLVLGLPDDPSNVAADAALSSSNTIETLNTKSVAK